jgi:membrane protease YdiL (CAAX protease family)
VGRIILGVALAIASTTTLDATGLTAFSALPLIPLFALFAWFDRIPPRELGFARGRAGDYALASGHVLFVMIALAALAYAAARIDLTGLNLPRAIRNIAIMALATFVIAIITEEGFFRGWMWAALRRRGAGSFATLVMTTVAFVLWHISFVFLSGDFHFGASDIPLFFVNATLLGLIWGLLRLGSGSIVASSAGHGVWNGLTYVLFGIGSNVGALGIRNVSLYGPEVGLYGAALNAIAAGALFRIYRAKLREIASAVSIDGDIASTDDLKCAVG